MTRRRKSGSKEAPVEGNHSGSSRGGSHPPSEAASSAVRPAKRSLPRPGSKRERRLWHEPTVALIDLVRPPGSQLYEEFQLSRASRRIDAVVLYKRDPAPVAGLMVPALTEHLGEVNLIELKGGSEELERHDCVQLLSYASQFFLSFSRQDVRNGLGRSPEPSGGVSDAAPSQVERGQSGPSEGEKVKARASERPDLTLFLLARQVTQAFREGLTERNGQLERQSEGIWVGRLGGWRLYVLESLHAWKGDSRNGPLKILTREFFENPQLEICTEEEAELYNKWSERLCNFDDWRDLGGVMARKVVKKENVYLRVMAEALFEPENEEVLMMCMEQMRRKGKLRLDAYSVEERLQGLAVEEWIKDVPAEVRLRGLAAKELLQGLAAEERAQLRTLLAEG